MCDKRKAGSREILRHLPHTHNKAKFIEEFRSHANKGACQKKNTGFFGSFSQMSDPPPTPPIWEASVQKKI